MEEQKRSEYIDKYLLGQLSESEQKSFLMAYEQDNSFRNEVDAQKMVFDALKQEEENMLLRAEMNSFHEMIEGSEGGKRIEMLTSNSKIGTVPTLLRVAAVLLILIGLIFILRPLSETPETKSVLATMELENNPSKNHSLGFTGEPAYSSITLIFIKDDTYSLHFQDRGDELDIYMPVAPAPTKVSISENLEKSIYELMIEDTLYILPKGLAGILPMRKSDQ